MATDVKKLAQAHALQVLGEEQYNENSEAAQALAEDFTAGWNAAVATQPAALTDPHLAELAQQGTALRTKIAHHSRGGLESYLRSFGSDAQAVFMAEAGDTLEALLDALPGLVDRVRQAEARLAVLEEAYEVANSYDDNVDGYAHAWAAIKYGFDNAATVKGGQPNA